MIIEEDIETKNTFIIELREWRRRSECGQVCGIFGCQDTPTISCPNCGNWYCKEHSMVHFHAV